MALSNAERQRRYRARVRSLDGAERLNRVEGIVRAEAAEALQRLADGYAVTKRGMLERLLTEAEGAVLARFDAEMRDAYLKGMIPLGALRGNGLFAPDSSELAVVADESLITSDSSELAVTADEQLDQGELFALPSLVPDLAMSISTAVAKSVEPVASKSVKSKSSASKGKRKYPLAVVARAIQMKDRSASNAEILAMIQAECGEAPDVTNLTSKLINPARKDPRVVEILATLEAEKGLKEKYTLSDKI